MIYALLYQQDEPVTLSIRHQAWENELSMREKSRHQAWEDEIEGWPEDTAGILDRDIAGFQTSQEAAQVFYSSSTFIIHGTDLLGVSGDYDLYRSGLVPILHMQNITLHVNHLPTYQPFLRQ